MIHVFHSITNLSKSSGGPTYFLSQLCNELSKYKELNCKIFSFDSNDNFNDFIETPILYKLLFKKFHFNNKFLNNQSIKKPTIIHHHGLWELSIIYSYIFSKKHNLPFIISPHGMFEPWSLKQNSLIKLIARKLYQNHIINNSIIIHATSTMEAHNIRNIGFKNRIAVIPNGINTNYYVSKKPHNYIFSTKKILFLSRIHKKKGVEILIEAFSLLDAKIRNEYKIEIVGNGEKKYINYLNKLIKSYSLENYIFILNPIYGNDKIKLLQDSYILVLPSYSENFGNVILESISCGTPVITTKETPWEILNSSNSGWCIDVGVESLFLCLKNVLCLDNKTLSNMSINARNLAVTKFDISTTALMHLEMYNEVINNLTNNNLNNDD